MKRLIAIILLCLCVGCSMEPPSPPEKRYGWSPAPWIPGDADDWVDLGNGWIAYSRPPLWADRFIGDW